MQLAKARRIAEGIQTLLRPYCERTEIAGSIRRGKAEVKDIEIVAQPLITYENDLLGDPVAVNRLDGFRWSGLGTVAKGGEKYKQIELDEGIKLDLFMVTAPAQWGVIFTIRTGPAEFSQWCVTQRKKGGGLPSDCVVKDGGVYRAVASQGASLAPLQLVPMADELDFLDFLGLGWVNPSERKGRW